MGVPRSIFHTILTVGVFVLGALVVFSASAEFIELELPDGADVDAYLYKPSGKGPYPAVIVLHHSRGLTDDIKSFSDDLSDEGYVILAIDFDSGGGFLNSTSAAYYYLQKLPEVDPRRIGSVGFSLGAQKGMQMAIFWRNESPPRRLRAFVAYYVGNSISVEPTLALPPFLFLHGKNDPEVSWKEVVRFCDEQKQLGGICEAKIYESASHAFIAKTFYGDQDFQATVDAFKRTVAFLNKHLRDAPIQ